METSISISAAIIATICSALIIFSERAFPFVLFSKKEPPAFIKFIEKYIPPMVMAALLVYCLKDISLCKEQIMPVEFIALTITVLLHLWKHNSLVSIFFWNICIYDVTKNILKMIFYYKKTIDNSIQSHQCEC